jgi:LPXTG-motif cell wall-anchored protein
VKSLCRAVAVAAALMAVAVGALAFVGASAGAQEYTPRCVVAVVYNQDTGILRVIGTGLQAGFTTPILLDGEEIGEATANGAGGFVIEIAIQLDGPINRIFVVSIQCSGDGDVSTTQLSAPPTTTTTTTTPGGTTTTAPATSGVAVHVIDPPTIDCAGNLRGFIEGAQPGTDVRVTLDHTGEVIAVVPADADGRAPYAVDVDLAPGTYTVTSSGQDALGDAFTLTESFTAPSGCGALSRTGTDSVPLAVAGVAAVGLGSAAVLFARRRRHDIA